MPKLKNKLPKMCKMGKYAVVNFQKKKTVLGKWGTSEAKRAYARFITELQNNPIPNLAVAQSRVRSSAPVNQEGLISELAVLYLRHTKVSNIDPSDYHRCETILEDFLLPLYADFTADAFSPRCLKAVRNNMIASKRFCREGINKSIRRIIAMFSYGVEEELCSPQTVAALREIKTLRKGTEGTFDHPPRQAVPDDVIRQTLPFLTPTLQAMVQFQWLTGLRPNEVFNLRVGEIDREYDSECWIYNLSKHKTDKHISGRKIYLSEPARKIIAPYLKNKKPGQFVFSPEQSEQERRNRQRAERKTPIQPSQVARDKHRAANPGIIFSDSYDKHSYRRAIKYAIDRGNMMLPSDRQIPHWTPYQIRHAAATHTEKTEGLDAAQSLLGHTSANMTKRYAHGQEAIQKRIALKQVNPFEEGPENGEIDDYQSK